MSRTAAWTRWVSLIGVTAVGLLWCASASAEATQEWRGKILDGPGRVSFTVIGIRDRQHHEFVADHVTHWAAQDVPESCTYQGHTRHGNVDLPLSDDSGFISPSVNNSGHFDAVGHIRSVSYKLGVGGNLETADEDDSDTNPEKAVGHLLSYQLPHADGETCRLDNGDKQQWTARRVHA